MIVLVGLAVGLLAGGTLPQSAAQAAPAGSADDSGFSITFVVRACDSYAAILANKARNNIQESLRDLAALAAGDNSAVAITNDYTPPGPGPLPATGTPGWLRPAIGTGIGAVVLCGLLLLVLRRFRVRPQPIDELG
ncbi:hypothetical protein F4553_001550 [Allocatelliglobosispora scoriae]|uniref:LPXTG cell wall anchor domain-containing protein n=1 Tax=Allocatelliglobosispora scoriae TaxID=643052 RepID=A0A841BMU8_9ACTN|nr:hypothetical protein [Allocatelliglobosispora scoriae]MBB5868171.1 hypothetical protein [Allocatelliglobosispora scoriae]